MDKIEVMVLNPNAVKDAEDTAVFAARLTQRGHKISCLNDLVSLYYKPYDSALLESLTDLPHPTIQKFDAIKVVASGVSRRFLAQITRHQNEVKFMSTSLQYSDYSGTEPFVVPYELLASEEKEPYLAQCQAAMHEYEHLIASGVNNDTAGYIMPQCLRGALLISATPFQWKHMIEQRICRRNTAETRYVMLRIWEKLYSLSPALFDCKTFCMRGPCKEGKMSCEKPIKPNMTPLDLLYSDFGLLADVFNA